MLVGTAIVIGAGLFVIYREHRLGIERAALEAGADADHAT